MVIDKPDYKEIAHCATRLSADIDAYLAKYRKLGYKHTGLDTRYDEELRHIKNKMESMLEKVSNSKNPFILQKAEEYPVLIQHQRPFKANSAYGTNFHVRVSHRDDFQIDFLSFRKKNIERFIDDKNNAELLQLIDEAVKADSIAV